MKKKCGNCRALCSAFDATRAFCSLGYKVDWTNTVPKQNIPLEECPKPVTVSDYVFQLKLHKHLN